MPDVVRLFEARGIRLGGSQRIVRSWAVREADRIGDGGVHALALRLVKIAKGEKVRNAAAFVTWAAKEPVGRWLPDRELDQLYRSRKFVRSNPTGCLRDEPEAIPLGSILAGVRATIARDGSEMEVDRHLPRL